MNVRFDNQVLLERIIMEILQFNKKKDSAKTNIHSRTYSYIL